MSDATSQPVRASVWMIGAIVSFTSMAVAGRAVSLELDTFEIMMYRSFLGIAIVLLVSTIARTRQQITRRTLGIHLVRNLSHFAGQNLWFFAITVAPLAQVFALEFTQPIWVMILAVFVLNEAMTKTRVLTAIVGFVGVLIVTQPWSAAINAGVITGALAAAGFAGSAVFTRLLTRTETITCILFWLTVMQAAFGVICAGYDGEVAVPTAAAWPWIGLIGCAGLVAHFCLTKALSLAPASVVVPVDFIRLPVITVVGVVLYNEPVVAGILIGAGLIFGANYMNILVESRNSRASRQVA